MTQTGRCLCGAVTYAFKPPIKWMAHCHCESCRRAVSAGFASYFCVRDGQWRWTGASPKTYESSPGVWRDFCGVCGSQMTYRAERYAGEIHFHAATLDDPTQFTPTVHVYTAEALPWALSDDGLPRK